MNIKKCLFFGLMFFSMAWVQNVKAQDFGVKSSTPAVFLIGGGLDFQGFHINTLNMPQTIMAIPKTIVNDTKVNLGGYGLHAKMGVRKYFGTSGFYFDPNITLSMQYVYSYYYCYTITNEQITLSYLNNDIVPSLALGYDVLDDGSSSLGLHVGVCYLASFIYNPRCIDKAKVKYGISNLSNFAGRFAITTGWKNDMRNISIGLDLMFGVGKPIKAVDCKLQEYDFQIEKSIFLATFSVMKKYQKY